MTIDDHGDPWASQRGRNKQSRTQSHTQSRMRTGAPGAQSRGPPHVCQDGASSLAGDAVSTHCSIWALSRLTQLLLLEERYWKTGENMYMDFYLFLLVLTSQCSFADPLQ